jgi:hypothetical protein
LSPDKEILAVADNMGPVRLFHYPTYNQGQACLNLDLPLIHGVQSVSFTSNYLITIGLQDHTLSLWRYQPASPQIEPLNINIEDVSVDHANPLLTLEDDINARLDRELQRESFVSGIESAGHNQFVN